MERAIRAIMGAVAGIFILFALIQALFAIPSMRELTLKFISEMYAGLIIGALVFIIVGVTILYFAIKNR
ncbi:hypothetical protein HZC30_07745 [Candidatus Woesearchaeota archaeon]|nr:hypothetical protein [Candidatus Woesearchaeota archaeon]